MRAKTFMKIWFGFELVSLGLIVFTRVDPSGLKAELSRLPPDTRARLAEAFGGQQKEKLDAMAVELDGLGLHTLSENVRGFVETLRSAA